MLNPHLTVANVIQMDPQLSNVFQYLRSTNHSSQRLLVPGPTSWTYWQCFQFLMVIDVLCFSSSSDLVV